MSFQSRIKTWARIFGFHAAWLVPLFAFGLWHWNFASGFLLRLGNSPWRFVFYSLGWWCAAWIANYALHVLWPVLLLIFYRTERERSPKKIITMGDRFRKMGLPAPQVYLLQEPAKLWRNRIWGFFILPSPIGALLLLDQELDRQLPLEIFDVCICRWVIESKFSRFSTQRFSLIAMLPSFTFIGVFLGLNLIGPRIENGILVGGLFCLIAIALWRHFQVARIREIDLRTINNFHLETKVFLDALIALERLNPGWPALKKLLGEDFKSRQEALEKLPVLRSWHSWAGQALVMSCFVFSFLLRTPAQELDQLVASKSPTDKIIVTQAVIHKNSQITDFMNLSDPVGSELSRAVESGDMRAIIRLMGQGHSIHEADASLGGATPLMIAAQKADLEMLYFLMSLGANVTQEVDQKGQNIVFYAVGSKHRSLVLNYVLRTPVNAWAKSSEGLTPLDLAVKNGWSDAVEILKQRGLASDATGTSTSH